jgi:hypothetical protein
MPTGFTEKEHTMPETAPTDAQQTAEQAAPTYTPPASQEEFDRIISDRLAREGKKYEGFDDFKAKAAKLDELEQANKSELEKYQERIAALEKENGTLASTALRTDIASAKGVPAQLLPASGTKEELEAAADALLAFKGTAPAGPVVSADGTAATATAAGGTDWLRRELTKK